VCGASRIARRFRAIGRDEAGEYRFGVVDVTTAGNSVRSVRPEQNANETLDAHRAWSLDMSRTMLAIQEG
jgi:hypothetical protein